MMVDGRDLAIAFAILAVCVGSLVLAGIGVHCLLMH